MLFALLLASVAPNKSVISIGVAEDRSIMYFEGNETPTSIKWRDRPVSIKANLPNTKTCVGYGHLVCSGLKYDGRLVGCRILDTMAGMPTDPDFQKAALTWSAQVRASQETVTAAATGIRFIAVDLALIAPGVTTNDNMGWGVCFPFCTVHFN